jgi:fibronectin-binding autotransporter adhesin
MRRGISLLFSVAMIGGTAGAAFGQAGATGNGTWENPATWTTGTVPGASDIVYIGSTYPSGAAATATVTLTANESAAGVNLGYGSGTSGTLDLGGNTLAIGGYFVIGAGGGTGVVNEGGGSFSAGYLYVEGGNTLNLGAGDTAAYLQVNGGSSVTTAAAGNTTGSIDVLSGSTLTLGSNLSLTGSNYLNVQDGSTLNMGGNSVTADQVLLGWSGSSAVTLDNKGTLDVTSLYIGNGLALNLAAADSVTNFYLNTGASTTLANNSVSYLQLNNGSSAATTATGGVTGNADVYSGSSLTLGANLTLGGYLNVQDGSTLDMGGHSITANELLLGWSGSSAVTVTNAGTINVNDLYMANGQTFTMHGGDVVNSLIDLQGGSVLTVQEVNGTGLTLNGTSASSLTIDPSSMDLIFTLDSSPNWDFRWLDPASGGNWIATIDAMIASGQIVVNAPNGYTVIDQGGYTYIEGIVVSSVPEPSSLMLACIAGGTLIGVAWRRRRGR